MQAAFLLAASDWHRKRVGYFLRRPEVVELARFLEKPVAVSLQHSSDPNGLPRVVTAVSIGIQSEPFAKGLARQRNQGFGAAG